jgi:hypothetical protein
MEKAIREADALSFALKSLLFIGLPFNVAGWWLPGWLNVLAIFWLWYAWLRVSRA